MAKRDRSNDILTIKVCVEEVWKTRGNINNIYKSENQDLPHPMLQVIPAYFQALTSVDEKLSRSGPDCRLTDASETDAGVVCPPAYPHGHAR